MNEKIFIKNDLYYHLTYVDVQKCYPSIQSYIFIGLNLGEEDEDTWYFEFLVASATHRTISQVPSSERRVRCLTKEKLSGMLDIDELKLGLEQARNRRISFGHFAEE